jgi:dephospho-CoA kinase
MRIGLTGGIGSGKSTVAKLLAHSGWGLVDADAISRESTAAGGAALEPIRRRFGGEVFAQDGSLDRNSFRRLIFADGQAKLAAEAIIHPLVKTAIAQRVESLESAGAHCIAIDIPLLVESLSWRSVLDAILVIDCEESTQIARVLARSQVLGAWDADAVRAVIAQQASRPQRRAAADFCIYNEGIDLAALALIAEQLATQCFASREGLGL